MKELHELRDNQEYKGNRLFPFFFKRSQVEIIKFEESTKNRLIFPLKMIGNSPLNTEKPVLLNIYKLDFVYFENRTDCYCGNEYFQWIEDWEIH